ncbi:DUF397 domain-containing protein [Embleya sp. NPDC055664]|uniref:DUF397 domain-containing protein n=1 Tax=Embleya sp. MST-111070 TaxID=3398231 RepID=UPI003F739D09
MNPTPDTLGTPIQPWRKATASGQQGSCVEVAPFTAVIGVRDSKDIRAGQLTVTPRAWRALLDTVNAR